MATTVEKEVKVFCDVVDIENRMVDKGFKHVKLEKQRNVVLSDGNSKVKLRKTMPLDEDGKVIGSKITFELIRKERLKVTDKYKMMRENSKELKDENEFLELMETIQFMGYNIMLDGIKHRKSYQDGGHLFEIDTWTPDIFPVPYLEIEILDASKSIGGAIKKLWTPKESKGLILCSDGITDLHYDFKKAQSKMYKSIFDKMSVFKQ